MAPIPYTGWKLLPTGDRASVACRSISLKEYTSNLSATRPGYYHSPLVQKIMYKLGEIINEGKDFTCWSRGISILRFVQTVNLLMTCLYSVRCPRAHVTLTEVYFQCFIKHWNDWSYRRYKHTCLLLRNSLLRRFVTLWAWETFILNIGTHWYCGLRFINVIVNYSIGLLSLLLSPVLTFCPQYSRHKFHQNKYKIWNNTIADTRRPSDDSCDHGIIYFIFWVLVQDLAPWWRHSLLIKMSLVRFPALPWDFSLV